MVDMAVVARIARATRLESVSLTALDCKLLTKSEALLSSDPEVSIVPSASHALEAGDILAVRANCFVGFVGKDKVDHLRILTEYELKYRLRERFEDKALEQFASVNGIYNAWPFFREAVHSVMCRMALPPFTLPLFTVGKAPSDAEPEGASSPDRAAVAP